MLVKHQNEQLIKQNKEIIRIFKKKERFQGSNFQEPNLSVELPLKDVKDVILLHDHLSDNDNMSELVCFLVQYNCLKNDIYK